jgi:preprotein translocase subunit SecF
MMKLLPDDLNFNFTGNLPAWVGFSALMSLACIAIIAVKGLNYGIDFAGGYEIQAKFDQSMDDAKVAELLKPLGLSELRVQRYGEESANEFLIMVREQGTITPDTKAALRRDVEKLAGSPDKLLNWAVAESGESLLLEFSEPITEAQLRDVLERYKLQVREITRSERADQPEYKVMLVSLADQVEQTLVKSLNYPEGKSPVRRIEFVGPQVGSELRTQGIMAVLVAMFFILIYIGLRFDLFFAPGALVAIFHDVLATLGVFALFDLEFNLPIVAALLTVVGYSVNDTIVVYDRVRENAVRMRGASMRAMVNASLNQTLARTILTGGTSLLVIVALWAFAGGVIREFSIALFVGILVGTYSSISVAVPLYIWLRERYDPKAGTAQPARGGAQQATV